MSVHPTALVPAGAHLGADVEIGPFTIVHDDVVLEAGCRIGAHCELGVQGLRSDAPLHLGAGATVRSHSVLYRGSRFGTGLTTGHHVTLREGLDVGEDCEIGNAAYWQGDAVVGRSCRTREKVVVGRHSRIGDFVWIGAFVVLTNDPHPPSEVQRGVTLEDFASIACMTTILPGVTVGRGALVGAQALVRRDVGPGRFVRGVPGRDAGPASAIMHLDSGVPAYPWRRHFHRGYPPEVTATWVDAADDDPSQSP